MRSRGSRPFKDRGISYTVGPLGDPGEGQSEMNEAAVFARVLHCRRSKAETRLHCVLRRNPHAKRRGGCAKLCKPLILYSLNVSIFFTARALAIEL
jgi:hypothetical protein